MSNILLLATEVNVTWYLVPLAMVISLVYSASRYEQTDSILRRAGRLFLTILFFMGLAMFVLFLLSFHL